MPKLEELRSKQDKLVEELDREMYELYVYRDSLKLLDEWYGAKGVSYRGRPSFSADEEDAAATNRKDFGELLQNAQGLQADLTTLNSKYTDKQLETLKLKQDRQLEDHKELMQSADVIRRRWESTLAEFAGEYEKLHKEKLDLKKPELVRAALQRALGMKESPIFDVKDLQKKQACLIKKMDKKTQEEIPARRKSLALMKELCSGEELGPVARGFVQNSSSFRIGYLGKLDALQNDLGRMSRKISDELKPEAEKLLSKIRGLDPSHKGSLPGSRPAQKETPETQRALCQLHFKHCQQDTQCLQETFSTEVEIGMYEGRACRALNREYGADYVDVTMSTPTFRFIRALENEVNKQKRQPLRLDGARVSRTQSVSNIRAPRIEDMDGLNVNHTKLCTH